MGMHGGGAWQFEVGTCVHVGGNYQDPAGKVFERHRLLTGHELYKLRLTYNDMASEGYATVDSMKAVTVGGATCRNCPFWLDGRCQA